MTINFPVIAGRYLPARAFAWWVHLAVCLLLAFSPLTASSAVSTETLAVVINQRDALSRRIGEYYAARRGIPDENVVRVSFPFDTPVLGKKQWLRLWRQVSLLTPDHVQAYALAWLTPFRVGCMSITSAFAFGFDESYCAKGCKPTRPSPYFNSDSRSPFSDYGLRPAMMVTGLDFDAARSLIDRGVAADATHPGGTAYLLETDDRHRNSRAAAFPAIVDELSSRLKIEHLHANTLANRKDVLFYFTGMAEVADLGSNVFLPGALADHLTSSGGKLTGGPQMSVLRWLEAGAVASYGTVVEPCNFPQKFPSPGIVISRYTSGETALESYWKSVAWPGQGVFVGEPLAAPFAGSPRDKPG